jgi:hypothetical protein
MRRSFEEAREQLPLGIAARRLELGGRDRKVAALPAIVLPGPQRQRPAAKVELRELERRGLSTTVENRRNLTASRDTVGSRARAGAARNLVTTAGAS